jgi:hypothetical protein
MGRELNSGPNTEKGNGFGGFLEKITLHLRKPWERLVSVWPSLIYLNAALER